MTGRARNILSRFPRTSRRRARASVWARSPTALALDLDTLSAALARVRRARRLLDADELRDLMRIAALHGIAAAEFAVLFTRFDAARALARRTPRTSDDSAPKR